MSTTDHLPEPHPSLVSSSDLFDGEIFGDELIDIYNSAVPEGGEGEHHSDDVLPPVHDGDEARKLPEEIQSDQYIAASTPADDGLGAFRPSTSFNDLTALLPPTTTSIGSQQLESVIPVAAGMPAPAVQNQNAATGIKREAENAQVQVAAASAKKQCTGDGTAPAAPPSDMVPGSSTNGASAPAQAAPDKNTSRGQNTADDTPNPLTAEQLAQVSVEAPVAEVAPVPNGVGGPVLVSPQPTAEITGDYVHSDSSVPMPALRGASPVTTTTEADFKSVAQAAVSSLILNVGTAATKSYPNTASNAEPAGKKIDTSTAHIKALTGNNWVAACSGAAGYSTSSAPPVVTEAKGTNRTNRQNLTPDERARQNRDRNREHARNTRLRKKAYVEELERTLAELVAKKDATDLEKRVTKQRNDEQREVRFRVIEEFLKLRGRNEPNVARWASILEEGFTLTLPVTEYRKMVHIKNNREGVILEQVLSGVSEIMEDSNYFASFLQSFAEGGHDKSPITLIYHCDRKNFFMDGSNGVLDWTASSVGTIKQGLRALSLRGAFKAKFNPASNKLLSANIVFDTGLVAPQPNHLTGARKHLDALDTSCDEIAAAAAAAQADAILDSLQMPHIDSAPIPNSAGSNGGIGDAYTQP